MIVHVILEGLFLLLVPPGNAGTDVEVLFVNAAAWEARGAPIRIRDHHLMIEADIGGGQEVRIDLGKDSLTLPAPIKGSSKIAIVGKDRFVNLRALVEGKPKIRQECVGEKTAQTCLSSERKQLVTNRILLQGGTLRACDIHPITGVLRFEATPGDKTDPLNLRYDWKKIGTTHEQFGKGRQTFNAAVFTYVADDLSFRVGDETRKLQPASRELYPNLAELHGSEEFAVIRITNHAPAVPSPTLEESFERHFAMLYEFLEPTRDLPAPADRLVPHRVWTGGDTPSARCIPAEGSVAEKGGTR